MKEKKLFERYMEDMDKTIEFESIMNETITRFGEEIKKLKEKNDYLQSENESLKSELRKECEEHEEFTQKAKAEIEHLKCNSHRDSWKNKFLKELKEKEALQKQVERLTEEKRLTIEKVKSQTIAKLKKDEILWAYQMGCGMYEAHIHLLKKQADEAYQRGFSDGNAYETKMDELALKYEQAVKDAAKEIFDRIFETLCVFTTGGKSEEYNEGFLEAVSEIDERLQKLAKEKGVELE